MSTRQDPEEAAFDDRYRDAARLIAEGRLARATLLTRETSDRRYRGVQLVIGVFEIEDGDDEPRTVVYEHIFGPALARRWRPGREVDVWIDPHDSDNVYIGR
ncbi:MAG: hypothetical protein ABIQ01_11785 [Pseudolysinimonas sp.]